MPGELKKLSEQAVEISCDCCNKKYVVKPTTDVPIELIPIAANEYISYRLLMLLKGKGVSIDVPGLHLMHPETTKKIVGTFVPSVAIDHIGNTGRITTKSSEYTTLQDIIYPDWVYYFDRWIGRLDGNGDNNLLLTKDKRVIAIDFSMAYHWACGDEKMTRRIDFVDVPCFEKLKENRSEKVKEIINALTDKEIYDVIFDNEKELCPVFISRPSLVSYYTGLCLRKSLI